MKYSAYKYLKNQIMTNRRLNSVLRDYYLDFLNNIKKNSDTLAKEYDMFFKDLNRNTTQPEIESGYISLIINYIVRAESFLQALREKYIQKINAPNFLNTSMTIYHRMNTCVEISPTPSFSLLSRQEQTNIVKRSFLGDNPDCKRETYGYKKAYHDSQHDAYFELRYITVEEKKEPGHPVKIKSMIAYYDSRTGIGCCGCQGLENDILLDCLFDCCGLCS